MLLHQAGRNETDRRLKAAPGKRRPTGSLSRTIIPVNSDVNVWRALLECAILSNQKEPET